MSNRQFSLTIKACDILENVPKRSRSQFVSDAIAAYGKKKGVFDEYNTSNLGKPEKAKKSTPSTNDTAIAPNTDESSSSDESTITQTTAKVNVDSGY